MKSTILKNKSAVKKVSTMVLENTYLLKTIDYMAIIRDLNSQNFSTRRPHVFLYPLTIKKVLDYVYRIPRKLNNYVNNKTRKGAI